MWEALKLLSPRTFLASGYVQPKLGSPNRVMTCRGKSYTFNLFLTLLTPWL